MGGFLTTGSCSRTYRNFLRGDNVLMEGDKVMIGGIPQAPIGKTLLFIVKGRMYDLNFIT